MIPKPISAGFLLLRGLGWRSIGLQSIASGKKPGDPGVSNLFILKSLIRIGARVNHIDWGNVYLVTIVPVGGRA